VRRARFLDHVGWTGGGIAFALTAAGTFAPRSAAAGALSFVQISDSHVGFNQAANPDVLGTFTRAVERINALPEQPAFVVHTGDVTHLSKVEEFDTAKGVLARLRVPLFVLPGEHDAIGPEGRKRYLAAFGRSSGPEGWYAFDHGGAHFVALVNVFNFETMGVLGSAQLEWLAKDLAAQKSDTPLVIFGHVPLYALYPPWGWTTDDGAKAIALLRRFAAVTVLNGHIHQVITKRDGNISFATANATAYPQPAPGTADRPGPKTVPAPELLRVVGYRTATIADGAVTVSDRSLAGA
jgi:3',5'-cyclic AMP phosphodiesterase CpdA